MASQHRVPDSYSHKRTKSVLSFMHKRNPSAGAGLSSNFPSSFVASPTYSSVPFLPLDHPHNRALGELHQNQQNQPPSPPKKSREVRRPNTSEDGSKSLHKKTLSAISLKTLGKDSEKESKSREPKPNKKKSTTNISNLLSRPKSTKNLRKQAEEEARIQKDKENRTPTSVSSAEGARPPPIYAQFSSEYFARQPLGGKFLEDQIDLYTPRDNGKQRDFHAGLAGPPTLTRQERNSQRPKSTYLPSSFSLQDISRRVSSGSRHSAEIVRRVSGAKRPSFERKTTATSAKLDKPEKPAQHKGHRVKPSTSSPGKKTPTAAEAGPTIPDKDVDKEFEAMLDRRNIPEHQRGKMRSLATSMKKDFIRQDWAEISAAGKDGRPGTNRSDSSAEATGGTHDVPEIKTKRPRSRTFTLSRASLKEPPSPSKRSKEEKSLTKSKKSSESLKDGSKSLTASGAAVAQTLIAKAKGQLTDDFVSYMRKVRKPELVEVGKLHKLRLLLRNETVAWTDGFIRQGGMEEIVGLLHRTMEVEWRFVIPQFLLEFPLTIGQRRTRGCFTS
jgi:Diaphanous GTPase-binding Domain